MTKGIKSLNFALYPEEISFVRNLSKELGMSQRSLIVNGVRYYGNRKKQLLHSGGLL